MIYSPLFEQFWFRYGAGDPDMDPQAKGAKGVAHKAWEKALKRHNKTEQEFADIVSHGYGLLAVNREKARKAGKWQARLPNVATWLNQDRWDIDVPEAASSYNEVQTPDTKRCDCGGEFKYRSKTGGYLCEKCYLAEWYDAMRKETNESIVRWTPRHMVHRYPKEEGESWVDWARRVSKKIAREANSPFFKYKPPSRNECPPDETYFSEWKSAPKMKRSDV